jgi:hypothetical protein
VRELLPPGTVTRPAGKEITLLDLATHHSGLPGMPDNLEVTDRANPYVDYHAGHLFRYLEKHGVSRPANTTFHYSNLGLALLGVALANRAGLSYEQFLQEQVTGPLGLADTVITPAPEQERRIIQGYNERHVPVRAWEMDALAPAGGIRSTAGDMLTYLEAQLHPERLGGTLGAAVRNSHELHADVAASYRIALAWIYREKAGVYWHDGAVAGSTSDAFFCPEGDYAAVVLLNSSPALIGSPDLIAEHIRQRLAGEPAVSLETVVIPASRGFGGFLRWFAAYWFTMIAAAVFLFSSVLATQGIAAQLLPRRLFLRASALLQMTSFCLFVSVYFLQPPFPPLDSLITEEGQSRLAMYPSYWFLGIFHQLNGSMHPLFAPLARRAWIGLAIAVGSTATAYYLAYVRTLRQIVESPDIVPAVRGSGLWPSFGGPLATAIGQFGGRTLLRSRQHRVILAFYLGIGFAMTVSFIKSPVVRGQLAAISESDPWHHVNAPMLAASVVIMGFWIVGTRVVFALPLDLRANWVFRAAPLDGEHGMLAARRRALMAISVLPAWIVAACIFLWMWPWRPAAIHVAALGLFGITLAEYCLRGPQKIPFACSYLPGKSNFNVMFWLAMYAIFVGIAKLTEWEQNALESPVKTAKMLITLAAIAGFARWRMSRNTSPEVAELRFEEVTDEDIQQLGIGGDGGPPVRLAAGI